MSLASSCSCLCPIQWNHVLSWEWRCSWSSADRRCSNYICVINNLVSHKGASNIRDLMVAIFSAWCREVVWNFAKACGQHPNPVRMLSQFIESTFWTDAQCVHWVRMLGQSTVKCYAVFFILQSTSNGKLTLVQVMACCCQATSHYLSQ